MRSVLSNLTTGEGEDQLWIVGEIHYQDRFRQKHCGGYGRCLTWLQPLKFGFRHETGPFNYDRPMDAERKRNYGE
jgi:hypothetical protein